MAPGPTIAPKRPVVKPTKIRYFKGKAPDAALSDSDEESDEDRVRVPEPVKVDKSVVAGGAGRIVPDGGATMKVALRDVKVEGGRVVLPKNAKQGEFMPELDIEEVASLPWAVDETSEEETDSEEEEQEPLKPKFAISRPKAVVKEEVGSESY